MAELMILYPIGTLVEYVDGHWPVTGYGIDAWGDACILLTGDEGTIPRCCLNGALSYAARPITLLGDK